MSNRPYLYKSTDELAALVQEHWADHARLVEIQQELSHRSRKSAVRLSLKIGERLIELKNKPLMPAEQEEQQINCRDGEEHYKMDRTEPMMEPEDDSIDSEPFVPGDAQFSFESLEVVRKRLLDLSGRNTLLNFRHSTTGCVRFIDELPDQLYFQLEAERELQLIPIPEPQRAQLLKAGYLRVDEKTGADVKVKPGPTAVEWAKWLGLNTSYELPFGLEASESGKHSDNKLQTLLFPQQMETALRSIRTKAQTIIEETGANVLYLAFGFLEWFETADSSTPRIAPLYLVPVQLSRAKLDSQTGTYSYTLRYTGEDIIANLSLREKLRVDFSLELPVIDENTTPELYFEQVADLIGRNKPTWSLRRYCTLALLNFGKLLMYLDLDPSRWPGGEKNITQHATIQRFFANSKDNGVANVAVEYEIDRLPEIHQRFPLIDDADSSQHSALVDAVSGKSLVIEGPPGTGKSQTITNLIAAALAQGKRVLFVAEKMAALEVVKKRLDRAGLGEFCLELHSHKTQKSRVLEDLKSRVASQAQYNEPRNFDAEIARYEGLKNELSRYAQLINSEWKHTGKTIHEILTAATRYRLEVDGDVKRYHPSVADGESLTHEYRASCIEGLTIYKGTYREIERQIGDGKTIESHPWYGVCDSSIQIFDTDEICHLLQSWQCSLKELCEQSVSLSEYLGTEQEQTFDELRALSEDLALIPQLQGSEYLSALPRLSPDILDEVAEHIENYKIIQSLFDRLAKILVSTALDDFSSLESLQLTHGQLSALGLRKEIDLPSVIALLGRVDKLEPLLQSLGREIAEIDRYFTNNFKTLVSVSEKGLSEYKKLVSLVNELKPSLLRSRDPLFEDDELDEVLPKLTIQVEELRSAQNQLGEFFNLKDLPTYQQAKEWADVLSDTSWNRWFKKRWRELKKQILSHASSTSLRLKHLRDHLQCFAVYVEQKEQLESNQQYRRVLGSWFTGIETEVEKLNELRAWYKRVRKAYGMGFGPRAELGNTLLELPPTVFKGLQLKVEQGILEDVDRALSGISELAQAFEKHAKLLDGSQPLLDDDFTLGSIRDALTSALRASQNLFVSEHVTVGEIKEALRLYGKLVERVQDFNQSTLDQAVFDGNLGLVARRSYVATAQLDAVESTLALAKVLNESLQTGAVRNCIYESPTSETFDRLAVFGHQLKDALTQAEQDYSAFEKRTQLDQNQWQKACGGEQLTALMTRNQIALDYPEALSTWSELLRLSRRFEQLGLASLLDEVTRGELAIDNLHLAFNAGFYDYLAREIFRQNERVAEFSGITHEQIRQRFCEYDENLHHLQRKRIAAEIARQGQRAPAGTSGSKVADFSEMALIKREVAKKTRHIPIRQLLKRAGQAVAAYKPCFMMGPMSVAQYLAPGVLEFDLVVMDEASQMKPEDALGAIARGKQLVVVGDPKQLPPTNFFNKTVNNEGDAEEQGIVEDSESILDAVTPLFRTRRLRWHYRSRHESLIAFSNIKYYDNDLVVFPSPHADSKEYGIKFTRVRNGRFVNRRNMEEARIIAESVLQHLVNRPEESVGVVAMNSEQREQIDRTIEELAKENPTYEAAVDRNRAHEEPLFVKNLENVQGDERDVIYISFTYGPAEAGGKVMQRFGPINSNAGWRRLNVLFTRSKKRMHVFSSMGAEDILVSENTQLGVRSLREFLHYAEKGHFHGPELTGREPDSDFEISVANALSQHGFQCDPQVGVAGYYLDLAVRDPGNPGRYIMGIECDGATYHSSRSARDRDRLRQMILENLGWRIRRIWSTDWFKNPQGELKSILNELNVLKSSPAEWESDEVQEDDIDLIDRVMEEINAEKVDLASSQVGITLRERLEAYDREVIKPACPDTREDRRLLRPAMLEALLEFQPVTDWAFRENIPQYLRSGTDPAEGRFLASVLAIIADYVDSELLPDEGGVA